MTDLRTRIDDDELIVRTNCFAKLTVKKSTATTPTSTPASIPASPPTSTSQPLVDKAMSDPIRLSDENLETALEDNTIDWTDTSMPSSQSTVVFTDFVEHSSAEVASYFDDSSTPAPEEIHTTTLDGLADWINANGL